MSTSWQDYEKFCAGAGDERVGWDHEYFDTVKALIREEKNFIKNPIEVSEGVIECRTCKSLKTFSYQKQVRSADEGFTTFTTCFNCYAQFRDN